MTDMGWINGAITGARPAAIGAPPIPHTRNRAGSSVTPAIRNARKPTGVQPAPSMNDAARCTTSASSATARICTASKPPSAAGFGKFMMPAGDARVSSTAPLASSR